MIGFLMYTLTMFFVAYVWGYFHWRENWYRDWFNEWWEKVKEFETDYDTLAKDENTYSDLDM